MRHQEEGGTTVIETVVPTKAKNAGGRSRLIKQAPLPMATKPAKKMFAPKKVGFRDESTGTVFYVTGPLAPVFRAQRIGLGLTITKVAELADVCESTVRRRETDTKMNGSWGYLRTNVGMLNALGLQLMGVSGA